MSAQPRLILAADSIHEPSWNNLIEMLAGVSSGDEPRWLAAGRRINDATEISSKHTVAYAILVLRMLLDERWVQLPTREVAAAYAEELFPKWALFLPDHDIRKLTATLWRGRGMRGFRPEDRPGTAEFSVVLGLMLSVPERQIADYRSRVSRELLSDPDASEYV